LDALLSRIDLAPVRHDVARVLDVGCGKGAMLLRAMQRFGAQGVGVEPNPSFHRDACARMDGANLAQRAQLHMLPLESAVLADAYFDLALCTGALHAFGGLAPALARLARLVCEGGWAIVGPGYWKQAPRTDYLAAIGASRDELTSLDTTLAVCAAHGWRVVDHHASTHAEWDDYEASYERALRRWLAAEAADPDAAAFRSRIDGWSAAYARWGRDTIGFALVLLRRS
jgi:cyclopropane fatty-acyl-phospholipid synthase-like methyltransferase